MKITKVKRILCALMALIVIGTISSCTKSESQSDGAVSNRVLTYRVVTENGAKAETAVDGVSRRLEKLGIVKPKVTINEDIISVEVPVDIKSAVIDSVLTANPSVSIYKTLNVTEMGRYGVKQGDYAEKVVIATALTDDEKKAIVDRLVAAGVGNDIKLVWSDKKKVYVGEYADEGTMGYELYALSVNEVFRPKVINTLVKKLEGLNRALLVFDTPDARNFVKFTEQNLGRQLAVVVDGVVKSVSYIQDPVVEGRIDITGDYTDARLRQIAATLVPLGENLHLVRK